jgi:cobalt transporter subunit CbtA
MIRRAMAIAVVAGLASGLAVSVLQFLWSVPLILEAETYENASARHALVGAPGHRGGSEDNAVSADRAPDAATGRTARPHEHDVLGSGGGFRRSLLTVLTNILIAFAFGLILAGIYLLRDRDGLRSGLLWGAAGFLVLSAAPAAGLPPELPGTAAADLFDRQLWWLGTAVCTGAGLALLVWARRYRLWLAGPVLIALPHLIGAPQPAVHASLAPPALQSEFIAAALVTNAAMWIVLGGVSGYLYRRLSGPRRASL